MYLHRDVMFETFKRGRDSFEEGAAHVPSEHVLVHGGHRVVWIIPLVKGV